MNAPLNIGYGLNNPLQKLAPAPVIAKRDPTTHDLGYAQGTEWINEESNKCWIMGSVTSNTAHWIPVGSSTDLYPITPYVVGPVGKAGYQTIQSAITAAGLAQGGAVYIMPGFYTENLTMFPNVCLVGAVSPNSVGLNSVTISGQHLPPSAGDMAVQNINFINNSGDAFYTANANLTGNIYIDSCTFQINGFIINAANWITGTWTINNCRDVLSSSDGIASIQSGVVLYVTNSNIGTNSTLLGFDFPTIYINSSTIGCNLSILEGSNLIMNSTVLNGNVVGDGASTVSICNCQINSGSDPAITQNSDGIWLISNTTIDSEAVNAIDGTGTGAVSLSSIDFIESSGIANTLTILQSATQVSQLKYSPIASTTTAGDTAVGTVTLVAGTATISTTSVKTGSNIRLTRLTVGATGANAIGNLAYTSIVDGTSFVINSVSSSNATTVVTTDVSTVLWEILA